MHLPPAEQAKNLEQLQTHYGDLLRLHYKKMIRDNINEPIDKLTKKLDEVFKKYLIEPEEFENKESFLKTNFDKVILNYNIQTAIHKDSHNSFHYSILTTWGNYEGYELILPDYRVIVPMNKGDVLIFDGQHIRHGNGRGTGERISIVGFCHK